MTGSRPAGPFTEIRVHGVGDHGYLGALGTPRVRQHNSWVETAEPPEVPSHKLRIINWSRSNRRNTGFLWYLAFPFTLVNVAGRMTAPGSGTPGSGGRSLRACVGSVAFILTLSQLLWLVALGETVVRHLPLAVDGFEAGPTTAVVAGLALAGWLLYRWRSVITHQDEPRAASQLQTAAVHGAGILAGAVVLAWLRPAQVAYSGWPSVATPVPGGAPGSVATVERLDAMALWIVVSTGAAVLAAAFLLARYWAGAAKGRPARAPEVAAGVLLVTALLLLHAVTALLRMALDNFLVYVTGLFGAGNPGRNVSHAVLLAYDSPAEAGDSRLDLFPFLALIAAAAVIVGAFAVLVLTPSLGVRPLWGTPAERARWVHRLVQAAPSLVPRIFPVAGIVAAGGLGAAVLLGEGRLGGPWLALAILLLHVAGAAVILVLLLGQLAPVRTVLGKIADIAGFWPVRDHPMAGVSYRDAVVAGIRAETQRADVGQVVLVAHSQGSVICAWLIAGLHATTPAAPFLVTAGSPLASLYASFFPTYFGGDFFRRVRGQAQEQTWVNFWRDTDPIGTAVPGADNRQLADPAPDDPSRAVRGHRDYWTAAELVAEVRRLRGSFPDPARPPVR